MELKSLKEFLLESESNNIRDYINYLEDSLKEIDECIKTCKKLDVSADEFVKTSDFIKNLIKIVNNSYSDLVVKSIHEMSMDELSVLADAEIANLNEELNEVYKKMDIALLAEAELKKRREDYYQNNGYVEEYYRASDTDFFFEDFMQPKELFEYLLKEFDQESIKNILKQDKFSAYLIRDLTSLFTDYYRILKYASNKNDKIHEMSDSLTNKVENILVGHGIDPANFVYSLQLELRRSSEFYKGLSEQLQVSLIKNGYFDNYTFHELLKIYREYKSTGTIILPVDKDGVEAAEGVAALDQNITCIKERIEALSNRRDLDALADNLCEAINIQKNNSETYASLRDANENVISEQAEIKSSIQELEDLITKIDTYLESSVCEMDFKTIYARKAIRLMNAFGDYATEKIIEPIIENEKKKYKDLKLAVEIIEKLEALKNEIDQLKAEINIFNKRSKEKKIASLYDEYALHMGGNRNFEKLINGLSGGFRVVTEDNYQEFKMRDAIPKDMSREYLNNIFAFITTTIRKIQAASKRSDNLYEFDISLSDLKKTLEYQSDVIGMYEALHADRKREHEDFKNKSELPLHKETEDLMEEFKEYNIGSSDFTIANIIKLRGLLAERIDQLSSQLSGNLEASKIAAYKEYYRMLIGYENITLDSEEIKKNIRKH